MRGALKGHGSARRARVLIWGGWFGSRNVGDEALALCVSDLVRAANPGKELFLWTFSLDPEMTNTQGISAVHAPTWKSIWHPATMINVVNCFRSADLIVISGGTPFFDGIHPTRIAYLLLAKVFRKRQVCFGVGAKPIRSRFLKRSYQFLLKCVEQGTARDERSAQLMGEFGLPLEVTTDSAFWMKELSDVRELPSAPKLPTHVDRGPLLVGFAPRVLTTNSKQLYLEDEYSQSSIDSIEKGISDWLAPAMDNGPIELFPMHFAGADSDLPILRRLSVELGRSRRDLAERFDDLITKVEDRGELTPRSYFNLCRSMDVVVAMRLHAGILAVSAGVPVVMLSYEEKVNQVFGNLGLGPLVLDLSSIESSKLAEKISELVAFGGTSECQSLILSRQAYAVETLRSSSIYLEIPSG